MDSVLIVFASVTTANKIKSELEKRYGIKARVIQTPKAVPVKSCSYCIRINHDDLNTAWSMIKSENVYTKGVFSEIDFKKIL